MRPQARLRPAPLPRRHLLAPAAPALLAFVYTLRAAPSAPQAPPAVEEQGSLDISIEPLGSNMR